jgi:hypothetical protein
MFNVQSQQMWDRFSCVRFINAYLGWTASSKITSENAGTTGLKEKSPGQFIFQRETHYELHVFLYTFYIWENIDSGQHRKIAGARAQQHA